MEALASVSPTQGRRGWGRGRQLPSPPDLATPAAARHPVAFQVPELHQLQAGTSCEGSGTRQGYCPAGVCEAVACWLPWQTVRHWVQQGLRERPRALPLLPPRLPAPHRSPLPPRGAALGEGPQERALAAARAPTAHGALGNLTSLSRYHLTPAMCSPGRLEGTAGGVAKSRREPLSGLDNSDFSLSPYPSATSNPVLDMVCVCIHTCIYTYMYYFLFKRQRDRDRDKERVVLSPDDSFPKCP